MTNEYLYINQQKDKELTAKSCPTSPYINNLNSLLGDPNDLVVGFSSAIRTSMMF